MDNDRVLQNNFLAQISTAILLPGRSGWSVCIAPQCTKELWSFISAPRHQIDLVPSTPRIRQTFWHEVLTCPGKRRVVVACIIRPWAKWRNPSPAGKFCRPRGLQYSGVRV